MNRDVVTNVMDVTTLMGPVTEDVIRAGRKTTVKNVIHQLNYSLDNNYKYLSLIKKMKNFMSLLMKMTDKKKFTTSYICFKKSQEKSTYRIVFY